MKKFLDEKFLLETKTAQYLYHGELLQNVRLNPMNVREMKPVIGDGKHE